MRDRNKLLPQVKAKLEEFETLAEENGLHFIVTQTLRTEEEQKAFYAQGRQSLDIVNALRKEAGLCSIQQSENKIVSNAPTVWDSYHGYGRAFDIAVVTESGKILWSDQADANQDGKLDWIQLGELGESVGLEWGGNFKTFKDIPHYQYTEGKSISQLKKERNDRSLT